MVAGRGLMTVISRTALRGNTSARLESVCGQMGVRAMTAAVGKITGPPAARAYAVEPVGELTIRPSQR